MISNPNYIPAPTRTAQLAMHDIRSLSSGTLSRLFGTTSYQEIEIAHWKWIEWCNHNLVSGDTWASAWDRYQHRIAA